MKLHLGSGKNKLEGWINVDINLLGVDLQADLTKKLPFKDESIEFIYNEHFIEHIHRDEALAMLNECYRILNKNGTIRISTPNLKYLTISYLSGNINEWGNLWMPINSCYLMNDGMRGWGHQFLYDAEELIRILSEAGFHNVRFVDWRKSSIEELTGLESRGYHHELIVEAAKNAKAINPHNSASKLVEDNQAFNNDHIAELGRFERLEQTLAIQATHLLRLEQLLATQSNHIFNVEADWAARGQRNAILEKTLKEKINHMHKIKADWAARGQRNAVLEKTLKEKINHMHKIKADWAARGQRNAVLEKNIKKLNNYIQNIEVELVKQVKLSALLEQTIADQSVLSNSHKTKLKKLYLSFHGKLRSVVVKLFQSKSLR